MNRAIASLHIKRPGGSRTRVTELVSASLEYSPEIIPTAIVSGYATAHPSIVGWTINAATIEDGSGLSEAVAAAKGSERLEIEVRLGDGYELVGDAYVASIGRGGSVGSRFETNISLLGAGALTETEADVSNASASLSLPGIEASGTIARELGVSGALALPATQISAQVDREAEASAALALGALAIDGEVDVDIVREVSGSLTLGALEAAGQVDREAEASGSLTLAALSLDGEVSGTSFVIQDTFTDTDGTLLSNHTPDVDTVGGGWANAESGNFEIQSNRVIANTGLNDREALIDTGAADMNVSLDVLFRDVSDNSRWAMVYARANSGFTQWWRVLLRPNVASELSLDEITTVRASKSYTLSNDTEYKLTIEGSGTSLRVLVDDAEELTFTSSSFQTNTWAGLRLKSLTDGPTTGYGDSFEVVAP